MRNVAVEQRVHTATAGHVMEPCVYPVHFFSDAASLHDRIPTFRDNMASSSGNVTLSN